MMKVASLLAPLFCFYVDESQSGGVTGCDACDGCPLSPFTDSLGQNLLIYIPWEVKFKARIGCHDEGSRRAWRSRRSRIGIKFIDPMNHTYGV
jgi:hypothetical protein